MINMLLSAAAHSLQARIMGEDVRFNGCSTDSRSIKAGEMFIALRGQNFDGHDFIEQARQSGAVAAMAEVDNGQSLPLLLVEDARIGMGKLAEIWRGNFKLPIIAVTGSNGKTTVKEMVSNILSIQAPVLATRGNLNNDIGVPLTLFNLDEQHEFAVIEMGANHPGEIAYLSALVRPYIAVITQCAPAHLEGFGSVEGVARAKAEIYEGLSGNGVAIINDDDEFAEFWRKSTSRLKQLSFGFTENADVTAKDVRIDAHAGTSRFRIVSGSNDTEVMLSMPGKHNIQNALAACACCMALNIPAETIKAGLEQSISCKGRLQFKRSLTGAGIFDDTYNANPVSLDAAMELVAERGGRYWLALGDMGELGPAAVNLHMNAGEKARELGFEKLFALGDQSRYAVDGFGNGARHFSSAGSMIDVLGEELTGDVTLLVKGSRAMAMENVVAALTGEKQ